MIVFYFLFYFDLMQSHETASRSQKSAELNHRLRFINARDSRNRKVRGLWRRGERFYAQVRVTGEKSARKIPLAAKSLTDAKEEMGKRRTEAREGALPKGGVNPMAVIASLRRLFIFGQGIPSLVLLSALATLSSGATGQSGAQDFGGRRGRRFQFVGLPCPRAC